jgi:hypothetical protein
LGPHIALFEPTFFQQRNMMPNQEERRAEERFATSPHVDCSLASPVLEDFGKMRLVNLARAGIGLVTAEPLAPGMLLVVKLVNPLKGFTKTLLVRVVQVTPQMGGAYLIGGTLDTALTYEELCALIM